MIDREKVIKGLECCLDDYGIDSNCSECPYVEKDVGLCMSLEGLLADALALLKASEPRLLTLEEVKSATGADLFLEISGYPGERPYMTAVTLESIGRKGISVYGSTFDFDRYGLSAYGWRLWTSRPTEAQREAEPWKS